MPPKRGNLTLNPIKATQPPPRTPDNSANVEDLLRNLNILSIEPSDLVVEEKLGNGQYGTVFRAKHMKVNRTMALKQIQFTFEAQKLRELKMELEVLRQSDSPYIVKFYGSYLKDTAVHYCMEFMDFGSLEKLYTGGVPEPILAKIAIAMVKGLLYMKNQLNVIHRDVKPTNVLLNSKGEIKLCDFGVSGILVESVATTYTGCSYYMAPERIDTVSSANKYDVRSDVWSLGVSLVEIGNGELPFGDAQNSVFGLLERIVSGAIPTLKPTFSPQAQTFVAQCLMRDFQARATYEVLLQHEWIKYYSDRDVDVSAWLRSLPQTQTQKR